MRKFFIVFFAILSVFSCQLDNSVDKQKIADLNISKEAQGVIDAYKHVGLEHNAVLEGLFAARPEMRNRSIGLEEIDAYFTGFGESASKSLSPTGVNSISAQEIMIMQNQVTMDVAEKVKTYTAKIDAVLKASGGNTDRINNEISLLEAEAISVLNPEDWPAVMCYAETAKASAGFWLGNLDLLQQWNSRRLGSDNMSRATGDAPWWIIVAADAAGAAEGALLGVILQAKFPVLLPIPTWAVASACAIFDGAKSSALTYERGSFTTAGLGELIGAVGRIFSMATDIFNERNNRPQPD